MKTKVFCVFDSKAATFGVPFFVLNESMALRSFTDFVNDPQTIVFRHPEDFSLFYIGEFDDEKGVLRTVPHENLGNASSFKIFHPGYGKMHEENNSKSLEEVK